MENKDCKCSENEIYQQVKTLLEIKQILDNNPLNSYKLLDAFACKVDKMINNYIIDICKDEIKEFYRIRAKLKSDSSLLRWIFYSAIRENNVGVENLNREKILTISEILAEYNPIIDDDIENIDVLLLLKEPHRFIVDLSKNDMELLDKVIEVIGEHNLYFTIDDYVRIYELVADFIDADNGVIFADDSGLPF